MTISTGKPDRFGGGDLFRERAKRFVVADARMAFRVAGDADGVDAAPTEHAGVDGILGAPERPVFAAVAGDHQHVLDAGLAVESRQEIIERLGAGEIAHRDMRHRLKSRGAHPEAAVERFLAGRCGTALR